MSGAVLCVIQGPTVGGCWEASAARKQLHHALYLAIGIASGTRWDGASHRSGRVTRSGYWLAGAGGVGTSAAVDASARGWLTIATPVITTMMPMLAAGPGRAP